MLLDSVQRDPQIGLIHEDLLEQVTGCRVDQVSLVFYVTLDNLLVDLHGVVLVFEGQRAGQKLAHQDAE